MKKNCYFTLALILVLLSMFTFSCTDDKTTEEPAVYIPPVDDIFMAAPLMGVNYGPYHHDGQAPGTPIPVTQIREDLTLIATHFKFLKTYTVEDGMEQVIPEAATLNLEVAVGVYCNPTDAQKTKDDIDLAVNTAKNHAGTVTALVIGNETDLPGANHVDDNVVAGYMDYAKDKLNAAELTDITVTSCLSSGGVNVSPQIISKCKSLNSAGNKVIMINIYPFYGQRETGNWDPGNISPNMNWSYDYSIKPLMDQGLTVIIGEIGWPSDGTDTIHENITNLGINYPATVSWINGNNDYRLQFNTFWFAMFDEPWKTGEPDDVGPHWGLYPKNNATTPKINL